jgi:hypothetical protein
MADSGVNITEGSGQVVDTRTEATNGNHRQVVTIGDPSTNAGVAPVDATNGLAIDNKTLPPGASTAALQTTLNGYVDQIEGYVDQIEGYVDGIEGSLTTISGNVDQLEGYVDGLETSNSAIQTSVQLIDDTIVVDDAAFTPATTKVNMAGFMTDETSTDSVDEGDGGAARMTPDRKQIVTPAGHTNGGATPYKLISAASTNATNLKNGPGQIYSIAAFNINAAVRYLKLYNKASAPTVGTDTPVHVFAIPGSTTGGGFTLSIPVGMEFTTGISFAITTGITDADTGAVAASELLVNIDYK